MGLNPNPAWVSQVTCTLLKPPRIPQAVFWAYKRLQDHRHILCLVGIESCLCFQPSLLLVCTLRGSRFWPKYLGSWLLQVFGE